MNSLSSLKWSTHTNPHLFLFAFLWMLAISVTSSLFPVLLSLSFLASRHKYFCVWLSPRGSHAASLINNYRVHKNGKGKKRPLCCLMSNMRETKITKRQNALKRRESLHIPFWIRRFCSWSVLLVSFCYCLCFTIAFIFGKHSFL